MVKKRHILGLLIALFLVTFWLILRSVDAPAPAHTVGDDTLAPEVTPAQKDDLIVVAMPLPQATVASPLVIKGQARGNWYFEASFPVKLLDAQGVTIAQTPASAEGDWMTTNYVPFTATLTFTSPPHGTHGMLVLEKDNPSDNPQFDDALSIPVTF